MVLLTNEDKNFNKNIKISCRPCMRVIDAAIRQWQERLLACVKAKGGQLLKHMPKYLL